MIKDLYEYQWTVKDQPARKDNTRLIIHGKTLEEQLKDLDIADDVTPLRIERARNAVLQSFQWFNRGILALKAFRDKLKYPNELNKSIEVLSDQYNILDTSFEQMDILLKDKQQEVNYWKHAYGEKLKESADYLELARQACKEKQHAQ